MKLRLAAGDTVVVLGGKDKGRRAKIKLIDYGRRAAEVESVNVVKRHSKPTPKTKGGIIEKEMFVPVGKLMYVCPKCNQPAKIAFATRAGARERVCRNCGEPAARPVKS